MQSIKLFLMGGLSLTLFGLLVFGILEYREPLFFIYLFFPLFALSIPLISVGLGLFFQSYLPLKTKPTPTRNFSYLILTVSGAIGALIAFWVLYGMFFSAEAQLALLERIESISDA